MMNSAKTLENIYGELLGKYASHNPSCFLQLEGTYKPVSAVSGKGEAIDIGDCDNDLLSAAGTFELMSIDTVRVLIPYDASTIVVARQLKKIAAWLENEPGLMARTQPTPAIRQDDLDEIPY